MKGISVSQAWFVLLMMLVASPVAAQFIPIDVEDPRPVEKTIEAIEVHCQCVITYEDPAYALSELIDMTHAVHKNGKTEPKILGLPPQFVSFHYDPLTTVDANLEFLLKQTRTSGRAFRTTRSDEGLHVIPEAGSILATPVTGVLKHGAAVDVIRSILNHVSAVRGTKIGLNGMTNLLLQTQVTLPAESGRADELLLSVWPQLSKRIRVSWKLLYDGQSSIYVFNLVPVPTGQTR